MCAHHRVLDHTLGPAIRSQSVKETFDFPVLPAVVFGGRVTLHAGGTRESYLLLPIIPPK